jgi:hypothetical protein
MKASFEDKLGDRVDNRSTSGGSIDETFALTISQDNVLVLWNAVSFSGRIKKLQKKIPRDGRSRIKYQVLEVPHLCE